LSTSDQALRSFSREPKSRETAAFDLASLFGSSGCNTSRKAELPAILDTRSFSAAEAVWENAISAAVAAIFQQICPIPLLVESTTRTGNGPSFVQAALRTQQTLASYARACCRIEGP
jgi:hypothetical protein